MPSHTFTRVGLWQQSIETNIASAAAAKKQGSTAKSFTPRDYQMYAYLQTAQDAAAKRLLDELPAMARASTRIDRVGRAAGRRLLRPGGDTRAVGTRAGRLGRRGDARGRRACCPTPRR